MGSAHTKSKTARFSINTWILTDDHVESDNEEDNDEERYSRQVYTMGARAHGLIRSSTIHVDGPIRNNNYHDPHLDDLGRTYIRGAMAEMGDEFEDKDLEMVSSARLVDLLVEFLRRLNPALKVSTISKTDLCNSDENHEGGVLLCVDRPYTQQHEWNEFCRSSSLSSSSWKFVAAETAGVYGRIFCDFGPRHEIHDTDGETPLVVPLDRVEPVEEEDDGETILVRSVEGEKHDVSRDDVVVFSRSDGSVLDELKCIVTRVETPERIRVRVADSDVAVGVGDAIATINTEAVTFARQKQVEEVSFRSLGETTKDAIDGFRGKSCSSDVFTPCDLDKSFDETRRAAVFGSFHALDAFVRANGRIPRSGSTDNDDNDAESFRKLAWDARGGDESDDYEEWKRHCHNFLQTCPTKFVPLQAIFGAVAAQECLKAVSGLYNPVRQFLLYDCDEVLNSNNEPQADDGERVASTGMSHILGSEALARLQNQKLFVVGSGAIGCEILKNGAAMGLGTGKKGALVVTDMDTIEKSNLSRQLLFRDDDIGKFKSKAAEEAVRRMNPSVNVECHTSKVGDEEDPGPFDSKFWSKGVDVILNALDNMEARLFMDGQCVANQKALVDAGTLGSKGNVQVVVPHQSESYGSSADPPEPAIPVCTLKNFPYAISHTIQWGRDLFDGLFVRRPRQANQYAQLFVDVGIEGLTNKLDQELGDEAAFEAAKELAEDLLIMEDEESDTDIDIMKKKAIEWAISLGKGLFSDAIEELLSEHPVDKLDEDGEPFWSGSRKPPQPLSFSLKLDEKKEEINKNMIDFVRSAARLRYETYTGIPSNSRENFGLVPTEKAKDALVNAAESAKSSKETNRGSEEEASKKSKKVEIQGLLAALDSSSPNDSAAPLRPLSSAEFEKDDDSNDHITFITAASNLRALCYGIAPVDAMETRKVAGKIIPAMITTTAFVSALSCIELVKLTQGAPLNRHRNAFINLALPFFAFTSPLPAEEFAGVRGETHTLWDRISIKEGKKAAQSGGLTLRRLLKRIQKKAYVEDPDAIQVSNISIGPIMIYANFLHEDDEELLNKSIWKVIEEAIQSGEEFDEEFSRDGPADNEESKHISSISSASFVDLAVSVEDTETYEEVELPQVRLFRS
eukprot:jgi/Psemu1/297610/fgenesh1_pm.332_\